MMNEYKNMKKYFDLYDKNNKNIITGLNFKLILNSVGCEDSALFVENDEEISRSKYQEIMNTICANSYNEESGKYIFNQYALEGVILPKNLKLLLSNHKEGISEEHIEKLVTSIYEYESDLTYDKFKNLNIF